MEAKRIYTVDFSQRENKDHDKLTGYIENHFCKGRLNDITEEENENYQFIK